MALRFYGEFKGDSSPQLWRVNIYDDDHIGSASEITLGDNGFTLNYEGDQSNPFQRIISSSVDISVSPTNSDFDTWVTTTLKTMSAAETKVKLEIREDYTGNNSRYWAGVILMDQIRIPDSVDDLIELTATDGLALLQKEQNVHEKQALSTLLATFLSELPTSDFWATGAGFLRYANDYYALGYTGSDYFATAEARPARDHNNLNLEGNPSEFNTYVKLEGLLSAFNMRIFQSEGYFWALPLTYYEQIADGTAASTLIKQVDKEGTAVALTFPELQQLNSYDVIIDGTTITRLRGGFTSYVAPKKSAEIVRITKGMNWLYNVNTPYTDYENVPSHGAASNPLFFALDSTFEIVGSFGFNRSPDSPIVDPDESLVTAYLRTTLDVGTQEYDGSGWVASAPAFDIELTSFLRDSGEVDFNVPISFITQPLTTAGSGLSLNLRIVFLDGTGADVSSDMEDGLYLLFASLKLGNDEQVTNLIYRAETTDDNAEEVELASTIFGSYPPITSLMLLNGSIDQDGTEDYQSYYQGYTWTGSQFAGDFLLSLVASDALRMVRRPLQTKSNGYKGIATQLITYRYEMWRVLQQGSSYYAPFMLSFNANRETYQIERFLIDYDATGISTTTGEENNPTDIGSSFTDSSGGGILSVNGVAPTGTDVTIDSDDIDYTGPGGLSITGAIGANVSNIDNLKSYVVAGTDKVELAEDANNKVIVDSGVGTGVVTLKAGGTDVLKMNSSEITAEGNVRAPGLELNSYADSLIMYDSTGQRYRLTINTDGTLRITSI